jgi:hypothetical protein
VVREFITKMESKPLADFASTTEEPIVFRVSAVIMICSFHHASPCEHDKHDGGASEGCLRFGLELIGVTLVGGMWREHLAPILQGGVEEFGWENFRLTTTRPFSSRNILFHESEFFYVLTRPSRAATERQTST